MKSNLEEALLRQIRLVRLPEPERECTFHPPRRWRFDFCYPKERLAIECEGGIWIKGAHNRPVRFIQDMEKYNQATLDGWRLLRFSAQDIKSGYAIRTITIALEGSTYE